MKTSKLFLHTTKNIPADTQIISHQLMLKAGLINKSGSGLYSWLPFGLMVLQNVEQIIREEMNKSGAQEVLMNFVQPTELWQKTGRLDKYGDLLLKFSDRHNNKFCLSPTHEELVLDIINNYVQSYKDLPFNLYQISTKFRDEIRPRFGIMRSREFIMKDAYSFHQTTECLDKEFNNMHQTYCNILDRIGLEYRTVQADSGEIGGSSSIEFHIIANAGEDRLAISDDFAANIEKAPCLPITDNDKVIKQSYEKQTIGINTIEKLAEFTKQQKSKLLKFIIVRAQDYNETNHNLIAFVLRGDHHLNIAKAEKLDEIFRPLTMATDDDLKHHDIHPGFIGIKNLSIPIIADLTAVEIKNFVCGANFVDKHLFNANWGQDGNFIKKCDLREIQKGDLSPSGSGEIKILQGIEIGHIFKLGTTYSQAMNVKIQDNQNSFYPKMGCYGIGVSRLVAATIEQSHDKFGIIWPKAITPFILVIAPINYHKNPEIKQEANNLYKEFITKNIKVLLDDRDIKLGEMLNDLELIGIPIIISMGQKELLQNKVKLKIRKTGESKLIDKDNLITNIQKLIQSI